MNPAQAKATWIAVDWGTSNLRVWAMDRDDRVLDTATSDKGMGSLTPDQFEPALLEVIAQWLGAGTTPVICCGMVGAKQGWAEAPYRTTPCTATPNAPLTALSHDDRIKVQILPGISQANPADVMRGEETQIAGYLAQDPQFDGILCLPGTHSKWVHISAREIVSFRTIMTGELFALLAKTSVLRHSVGDGWDEGAFAETLTDTISRPENLTAKLFSLRAESLLGDQSPATARARLSGLLIGAELAATRPYWLGQNVTLIGDGALAQIYAQALQLQGITPGRTDAAKLTLAGLTAAYHQVKGH